MLSLRMFLLTSHLFYIDWLCFATLLPKLILLPNLLYIWICVLNYDFLSSKQLLEAEFRLYISMQIRIVPSHMERRGYQMIGQL